LHFGEAVGHFALLKTDGNHKYRSLGLLVGNVESGAHFLLDVSRPLGAA
jgi:hypothetical protein